ncbi:MAG: glutamate synthase [Desulfobacterales bacterium]|nr:glutamate synthase [Desulfobacterales bacterium]
MKAHQQVTIRNILASRAKLPNSNFFSTQADEEGGCGVTGFIASVPVSGRHIYEPSVQMHNRGNGKGGGIAAIGLSAKELGVSQEILEDHYLFQVAYLDPDSRKDVESAHIEPFMDVSSSRKIPTIDDYRDIGLEVKPPDVWQYFIRIKPGVLTRFVEENDLAQMDARKAEDEYIYQNTFRLNQRFYASLENKKAFVLSQGRNLMILKVVGYAEQVTQYYCLEDFKAHGWIAHQRYPTRGRLWHPGGAHPFSGLNEALVHNGDFANYHSVSEYLRQHHIYPQFLTDTEVSVLLFDLMNRTFNYPLEYIIEALAPTTEYDFDSLPSEKQKIYRYIQSQHIGASPDGPWFFIIARNNVDDHALQLIGITDTAMLRPQVFALQDGEVQIGLICSEKQAIDATLQSLATEDPRFHPIADTYWNARGGSAESGGAFIFSIKNAEDGLKKLVCTNKFGEVVNLPKNQKHLSSTHVFSTPDNAKDIIELLQHATDKNDDTDVKTYYATHIKDFTYDSLMFFCNELRKMSKRNDHAKSKVIDILTYMNDMNIAAGTKKRSSVLQVIRETLSNIFDATPNMNDNSDRMYRYIDFLTRRSLRAPQLNEKILVINARGFQPEGPDCDSRLMNAAYALGWKQYICYGYKGQRFTGCGFGKQTDDVRIDVYDSSGDYLASGIDGMQLYVHGNAQDQVGQIMKRGKLVIYGDVGQTFMYGAKGGNVYVLGNAAGRPLINGTGQPRVVINGTCLDYLAESFMAGDPLNGGGFVILNGIMFDEITGRYVNRPTPYPGSNLFSLASGGAIYLRDPYHKVVDDQLNGGEFKDLTSQDWEVILPYLKENENLFGISIEHDLLTIDGQTRSYTEVYRKIQAVKLAQLAAAPHLKSNEEYGEEWDDKN